MLVTPYFALPCTPTQLGSTACTVAPRVFVMFGFTADAVVPGAGAFEIAAHAALVKHKETVKGRARLGECHVVPEDDVTNRVYSLPLCGSPKCRKKLDDWKSRC